MHMYTQPLCLPNLDSQSSWSSVGIDWHSREERTHRELWISSGCEWTGPGNTKVGSGLARLDQGWRVLAMVNGNLVRGLVEKGRGLSRVENGIASPE